ncbi:MAG: methyltransferase domain-containing protein [Phycisphaerae bacterium]|nr:class I SAM-dependent methyltransferase [Phycisphaerae bacterium]NIR62668.1 class I SAM-dependent methyltransferase [candidate division Zixibacteria bacterium]NIP51982.1 class I SAM-dependent methyltransferase [Phycisphaerae bacterium]NIS54807.1 class I SAM-dependent methyltransferase [Phycisphaerae bacterium]NIU10742.1 class I SAM-dependent methyltransferase [Phycisphaerae bacterium]
MKEVFVAKWYHLLIYPDWFRRLHQRPGKFLAELVKPAMTVVDIGCGLGFYTREMAQMVGEKGRVIAIDFQPEMLGFTEKKVRKAAVSERVEIIQCTQDDLVVSNHVDFALSMWVAHEVPDRDRFFRQICDILKPDGKFLLAEPNFHVRKELYKAICDDVERAGLKKISEPRVGGSRAALFAALSE